MAEELTFPPLEPMATEPVTTDSLSKLRDVPVQLSVEIGRTSMTIGQTLGLTPGAVVSVDRLAGEPVDLLVNGRPIARGEVVVIGDEFGLRITEVVSPAQRLADATSA